MRNNLFFKVSLFVVILLVGLFGFLPLFQIETAKTEPGATFEYLRISAIFDDTRNREYLYVFDTRNGDVWKYNMDTPEEEPKYIGRVTEPGKGLRGIK